MNQRKDGQKCSPVQNRPVNKIVSNNVTWNYKVRKQSHQFGVGYFLFAKHLFNLSGFILIFVMCHHSHNMNGNCEKERKFVLNII
jgi:hypothetical protein